MRSHSLIHRNSCKQLLKQLRVEESRNSAEKKKKQERKDLLSLLNTTEGYKPIYGNNGAFPRRNSKENISRSHFHLRRDVISEFFVYTQFCKVAINKLNS